MKKKFTKRRLKAAFLSEFLNDSPPQKVKLRKELQQKSESNLEQKRKPDDSIVGIEELDNEIKLLTNEYETKINNMALMEQQYGDVITKMSNDRNDDNTVKNKLMEELTELQSRYEEMSKELNVVEKKSSSNKVKNLNKKLKTSKNTTPKIEKS